MKGIRFISSMACVAVCSLIFFGACSGTSKVSDDSAASVVSQGDSTEVAGISGATYQQGLPTVIDFYATWCGPCKAISPVFEKLKGEYSDKVNFVSIDVDQDTETAMKYSVSAMPTFVFLDADGNEIKRIVGADPEGLSSAVEDLAR